jgi:hypothetical protein
MTNYKYIGRDRSSGAQTTGSIEAASKSDAVKSIEAMWITPSSVKDFSDTIPMAVAMNPPKAQNQRVPQAVTASEPTAAGRIFNVIAWMFLIPALFVALAAITAGWKLGLVMFVIWGFPPMFVGFILSGISKKFDSRWVCSECRNRVDNARVRICPVCRETLHPK